MQSYQVINHQECTLGEGVLASKSGTELAWVDIEEKKIYRVDDDWKLLNTIAVDFMLSNIFHLTHNSMVFLDESGISSIDFETEKCSQVFPVDDLMISPELRGNDGIKVNDTFIFGTMLKTPKPREGRIYSLEGNKLNVIDSIGIPNTFILKGDEILISDSLEQTIYSYNTKTWQKKLWSDLKGTEMTPDGGIITKTGRILVCMWGGSCIGEFNNDGTLINLINLPVTFPTNCCEFNGGLVVTSAKNGSKNAIDGKTIFLEV